MHYLDALDDNWMPMSKVQELSKQKRRPGRPPRSATASLERIEIRVTKAEKRTWERDAKACGRTLSEWIRHCVNAVTQ